MNISDILGLGCGICIRSLLLVFVHVQCYSDCHPTVVPFLYRYLYIIEDILLQSLKHVTEALPAFVIANPSTCCYYRSNAVPKTGTCTVLLIQIYKHISTWEVRQSQNKMTKRKKEGWKGSYGRETIKYGWQELNRTLKSLCMNRCMIGWCSPYFIHWEFFFPIFKKNAHWTDLSKASCSHTVTPDASLDFCLVADKPKSNKPKPLRSPERLLFVDYT